MGSPLLVPTTNHILDFNRRPSEHLGILPQLPILLGGKTICIDVMGMQGPLDFHFFLGHDYMYVMKVAVSIVFQVMNFPHNGNIVTINPISFISSFTTFAHPTFLSVPNILVDSSPP